MKEPQKAYTFKDIGIKPQYSEVRSRSDVDTSIVLKRIYVKLSAPIISSPMPDVTEWKMAKKLDELGGVGIIHRFMSIDEQVAQIRKLGTNKVRAAAVGVNGDSLERVEKLVEAGANLICIDVAYGHSILMKETFPKIRKIVGENVHLMAGNVATAEGFVFLQDLGADSIRCGIGNGCFVPGTVVTTRTGEKEIQNIEIGDEVKTHKGRFKKVIDTLMFDEKEEVVVVNDLIECTKNHEFYVVHKDDVGKLTDDNFHHYTKWVEADKLTEEYFLVEGINADE